MDMNNATVMDRSWVEAAMKDVTYIAIHRLYDYIKYKDSRVFLREDGCVDLTDELLDELTAITMEKVDKTEYTNSAVTAVETVFEYFDITMDLKTKETAMAAILAKFMSNFMRSIDDIIEHHDTYRTS